ncbi:MAG TPA: hypothetical protein VHA79_01550 [Mycobacteriales bacterium]|jgi:hypothetical protein|nr:hypothetical protein [Mycobacteriales bacterium]
MAIIWKASEDTPGVRILRCEDHGRDTLLVGLDKQTGEIWVTCLEASCTAGYPALDDVMEG